jgi:biopolymer transport protein ExbD
MKQVIEFETFNDKSEGGQGPDLTPLIDMVFLLLIFFLLTSFFIRPTVPVDLPEASEARYEEQQDVTITIEKEGRMLLNGRPVSEKRLADTLLWIFTSTDATRAVIQSDRSVPFGRVVEAMDIAKQAGAEGISFLVEQRETPHGRPGGRK